MEENKLMQRKEKRNLLKVGETKRKKIRNKDRQSADTCINNLLIYDGNYVCIWNKLPTYSLNLNAYLKGIYLYDIFILFYRRWLEEVLKKT